MPLQGQKDNGVTDADDAANPLYAAIEAMERLKALAEQQEERIQNLEKFTGELIMAARNPDSLAEFLLDAHNQGLKLAGKADFLDEPRNMRVVVTDDEVDDGPAEDSATETSTKESNDSMPPLQEVQEDE